MTYLHLPLQRFPLLDTRKVDDMQAIVHRLYGEHSIELVSTPKNFRAQLNFCKLQSIGLYFGKYGTHIRVSFPNLGPYIIGVPLHGNAVHKTEGVAHEVTLTGLPPAISAGAALALDFGDDFNHLALYIDPGTLTKKLAALIGKWPDASLKFDASASEDRPEARTLRRLIMLLVDELDATGSQINPLVTAELEQAIMVCYLCSSPNNYSRLLGERPKASAPWQVCRAEEYIRENWDQPITIEALALITNASIRSLFHTFRASRGYSPMSFVKQVRLRHAREMLSQPGAVTSVSDVAYACGFNNLGHFAKDYFQSFGERPSSTLNTAKGAIRNSKRKSDQ
jgi:AraC-like DNA-binding protein